MGFLQKMPVFGGLLDDSDQQSKDLLAQNQAMYGNLQTPNSQFQKYTPEAYQYDYNPQRYQANTVQEDPSIRNAQLEALQKLSGLSQTGLTAEDQAAFQKARDMSQQQARGGREAALQNAQARGMAGSGMEFALGQMADQGAAGQAQQAGLDQAAQSARQRALYTQAYGQGLQNLRQQDYGVNAGNADILNRFNQMNTNAQNEAAMGRNQWGMQNAMNRNYAQQYNQGGQRGLSQQDYENQLSRIQGRTGANNAMDKYYAAQGAANAKQRAGAGAALGSMFGPMGTAAGGAMGNAF